MMIAYFDCFSGISGDTCLGALLACGGDVDNLRSKLSSLGLGEWTLVVEPVSKHGIGATAVSVMAPQDKGHGRHLADIERIIARADLPSPVKTNSIGVFRRLAEAEAKVHQSDVQSIHFHEVGAIDAIIDIVGACLLLDELGVDAVWASPLPMGRGFVTCQHGRIPLPAPAVVELVRGVPAYGVDLEAELVTPTGAALITSIAGTYGPCPSMRIGQVGYGAGSRDLDDRPNLLRVWIGEAEQAHHDEDVVVIETNVDDLSPQFVEIASERLFAAGALDVYLTPVQMKKNRPGVLITVVARPHDAETLARTLIENTTTLGVRMTRASRMCLERRWVTVETEFGPIRVKVGGWHNRDRSAMPEYDDVRATAVATGRPAPEIWEAALWAYRRHASSNGANAG